MQNDISILRIKAFRQIPLNRIFAYPIILSDKVPTPACLDKQNRIYINPELLEALDNNPHTSPLLSDFATTVLLHEVLHDVLDHLPRRDVFLGEKPTDRQVILWNLAADVVVNELLMKWAPIAQSYKNLIACLDTIDILPDDIPLVVEVIYRHLYNNTHVRATKYTMQLGSEELEVYEYEIVEGKGPDQVRDLGKIDGSNKEQDNDANGGNMSDSDQRNQASNRSQNKSSKSSERVIFKNVTVKSANDGKHKSQFKYAFPELVEALKQAGKTSCDLDRELQFVKSPVDLTRYLNKYFENVKAGLDDVSFLRMSRLDYLLASIERQRRLKLPAYVSRTVKTVIGIDSSGSISDDEYEHFISIIWKHRDILEGKVVVCDCDIKSVLDLKDSKKTELEKFLKVRRGYGGTSYEPVFEIAERENVEIVIYFTDLFPDRFPENPKFKVLWVVKLSPESYSVDVPYGTVIWF